ncbi:RNA polymerase sigma-I factor [Clostridium swellfunianum]|uniref:RNA polymerase sigma-I factor n=1 Tax=Clostridium swellfunianum TaxID=1367462 RepID=UPI00202DCE18|nr:RNA polymerase sigma-I factor [Clostridium swellfunianum]MCM0649895.1 RNA polymerase sigma-I factor [Clostridium swellfunianum]
MDTKVLSLTNRDTFIEENKAFIYSTAFNICKRRLSWENDDELSLSLIAFNNACDSYNKDKGNFYSYAKVIIRNALIDYFRKMSRTPYVTFDSEEDDMQYIEYKTSMDNYELQTENKNRAEEIALFSKELKEYKLDFNSLVDASPSHKDTRDSLLNLAFSCAKEESILNYVKQKRLLPVKEIMLLTGSNRKLIEKWRKYILILILILSTDEYPYIKSYLNIKVGENNEK